MAFGVKKRGTPKVDAGAQHARGDATDELAHPQEKQAHPQTKTGGPEPSASPAEPSQARLDRRSPAASERIGSLVRAIEENDEATIESAILRLSKSRRVFAPLAFAVASFVMLFGGLRLLVSNWRLTLVQILPAMWIWLAMLDLKAHALHGKSFHVLRGPILVPLGLVIVAITIASFFINALFAFAISRPGAPEIRPAVAEARQHLRPIIVSGAVLGVLLALATLVITRSGRPWFAVSLGIVVGVMMVCYVAIPSRLIGVKRTQSRRDKLAGAMAAVNAFTADGLFRGQSPAFFRFVKHLARQADAAQRHVGRR